VTNREVIEGGVNWYGALTKSVVPNGDQWIDYKGVPLSNSNCREIKCLRCMLPSNLWNDASDGELSLDGLIPTVIISDKQPVDKKGDNKKIQALSIFCPTYFEN